METGINNAMSGLKNFFKGKKVLITGHTGFKGSWLSKILLNLGADVVGIAFEPHTKPNLFAALGLEANIKNYFNDIRNFEKISEIFARERPEIVFHLAAQALVRESYDNPLFTVSTNVLGTANILENIRNSAFCRSAVIITTDKVYKDIGTAQHAYSEDGALGGHDLYSASKAAADIVAQSYLKSFGVHVAVARAGNVIGGGDWSKDRLMPDLIRAVYESKTRFIMRNPYHVRPWQHVFEPLRGYMLLSKVVYENKLAISDAVWNFGPRYDDTISVLDVVKMADDILGGVRYEAASEKNDLKYETEVLKLDSSKAKRELGWDSLYDAKKSVALAIDWYRNFYSNKNGIREFSDEEIKRYFN